MTKVIDLFIEIESFDNQRVIIKGLFQSELLKQHMVTIGVDQLLSDSTIHEHRCMEKIKKLNKSSIECNNQQNYKVILETSMISKHEGFIENSQM